MASARDPVAQSTKRASGSMGRVRAEDRWATLEEIKTMPDRYRTGAAAEALHLIENLTEGENL